VKTTAVFFPFDLFGSGGAGAGANLLADAFTEMLDDNRREKKPTRAVAYQPHVRMRQLPLETLEDYRDWRKHGRQAVRSVLGRGEFLLWMTGNHLGVLPVYDELSRQVESTLVIQIDAHLDVYNLSDCTDELSHGNFLLHVDGPLPRLINLGHRELLLRPDYVERFYHRTFAAAELLVDPGPALAAVRAAAQSAQRIFIDIDCDALDPAFFPAVSHPLPFGLTPQLLLSIIDAAWSPQVTGIALSEFDPGRDVRDQSLSTLVWLIEHLLLRCHENAEGNHRDTETPRRKEERIKEKKDGKGRGAES
jgi:arginase family enzyme